MLLNICFLQCLQKLLLALVTIFLVLQIISSNNEGVWAPSLFDIWFDLFHEFIVYGDFASHFSPFKSKNRGSDGRPCLNNFCENFFFPLLRSQEGPCSHSPTPSLFWGVLCVSSFPAKPRPGEGLAGWGRICARLWVENRVATTLGFVHSFSKHLWSIHSWPGPGLGSGYNGWGTGHNPCPPRAHCLWGKSDS